MAELSRRRFLATASMGVVAAGAVAGGALVPSLVAAASDDASGQGLDVHGDGSVEGIEEDIIAHVHPASTGEVSILVGDQELVVRDPELVSRLAAGARRAAREV